MNKAERAKDWAVCLLFWGALLSVTHDMTEVQTCVAENESVTQRAVAYIKEILK